VHRKNGPKFGRIWTASNFECDFAGVLNCLDGFEQCDFAGVLNFLEVVENKLLVIFPLSHLRFQTLLYEH
jgi:hypothetical protein